MKFDVVIIGAGPNGLAAGIELQKKGLSVLIVEGKETIGGGTRTSELTLPGFRHDHCSAVHPAGYLSPYLSNLPLNEYGLEWIFPEASLAHPLDDSPAVLLYKSIEATISNLDECDVTAWRNMVTPFVNKSDDFLTDAMAPLRLPRNPLLLLKFGLKAFRPASEFADSVFKGKRAKALFAGCAAHSILPFDWYFSSAIGLVFSIMGHVVDWPIAKGGSISIIRAMAAYFESLGGKITTSFEVRSMKDLPEAKYYFFDTDPLQLAEIAQSELPQKYLNTLKKYEYGPGVFKIDFALSEHIPWKDMSCLKASTVHVGGPIEEIIKSESDAWKGKHTEKPFLILCQQSQFDSTRAPLGKHTGYAYCHVPNGSSKDMTSEIENQIERFAPGFKDIILAKHTTNTKGFYQYNRNFYGGAVTGGAANFSQLFSRPALRLNPYSTPNPNIFICSSSSPPGGGVHGLCGWYAARSLLNKLK